MGWTDRERYHELLPFYMISSSMYDNSARKTGSPLPESSPGLHCDIASYISSASEVPERILAAGVRNDVDMRWTKDVRSTFSILAGMLRTYSAEVLADPYYGWLSQRYPAELWPLLARRRLGDDPRYDKVAMLERYISARPLEQGEMQVLIFESWKYSSSSMSRFMKALHYPQGMLESMSQHLLLPKTGLGDDFATEGDRVRTMALLRRNSADISSACAPHQEAILSSLHRELHRLARKGHAAARPVRV